MLKIKKNDIYKIINKFEFKMLDHYSYFRPR